MKKIRKDSFGGKPKSNKYANLKPSEQKNTAGQRRERRLREKFNQPVSGITIE